MRKACIDCVIKHLGEAWIFSDESKLGYPEYYVAEVGSLSHASAEAVQKWPELANEIRMQRIELLKDMSYMVPYVDLAKKVVAIKIEVMKEE